MHQWKKNKNGEPFRASKTSLDQAIANRMQYPCFYHHITHCYYTFLLLLYIVVIISVKKRKILALKWWVWNVVARDNPCERIALNSAKPESAQHQMLVYFNIMPELGHTSVPVVKIFQLWPCWKMEVCTAGTLIMLLPNAVLQRIGRHWGWNNRSYTAHSESSLFGEQGLYLLCVNWKPSLYSFVVWSFFR